MAEYKAKVGRRSVTIQENFIDRAINFINPTLGARRLKSRIQLAISEMYFGASTSRRSLSEFNPQDSDPNSTLQFDLDKLRQRSRDMIRNVPLASGAINTVVTNVVGSGLSLQSRIDRSILNLTDEQADAWESKVESEWSLFWDTPDVDAARTLNGPSLTELVFRQALENGESFVNLPRINRGTAYDLKLQVIESDRVCNEGFQANSDTLFMGIAKDQYGAPVAYHVCNQFPYTTLSPAAMKWTIIQAYGNRTGLKNMIHLFRVLRPGQTRGIPYLSPVVESLKQLGRYSESELMAAVISSMLTVFIKTESGDSDFDVAELGAETGASSGDKDVKLGYGAIIDLAKNEDISVVNPSRPNAAFDPFVQAILRQIGVALELPFEVLIKHFTASYSAARSALLEAWKFFNARRKWLADNFCQPVFEVWLYEAVASGRIAAPGFFNNPLIKKAYCTAEWVGPAQGQIDPVKEVSAAEKRLSLSLTTRAQETASLGGDFDLNIKQIKKERGQMQDAGINPDIGPNAVPPQPEKDDKAGGEEE
ncbi:MAG: phage portal protein [Syntrophorhabdaceae bacterium]